MSVIASQSWDVFLRHGVVALTDERVWHYTSKLIENLIKTSGTDCQGLMTEMYAHVARMHYYLKRTYVWYAYNHVGVCGSLWEE